MSRVRLGRVSGVYGIQGWVRLASETRPIDNILRYRRWWIGEDDNGFESHLVASRPQGNGLIAQITDPSGAPINDRDSAQRWVGKAISVDRSDMPRLPEGEYYWVDLIGLAVVNLEGEALGEVTDVTSNGAQDVLIVHEGDRERLIPFVNGPVIKQVEMDARRIVCDWHRDY
ncbi:ribosome maturation factor RimM [Flagellatimonas centrodinii]|uniref:ribosome maturation factor RimM n=1 Tax=Flagellatimonas centrodinii TaxID=2806210 RepID=UPI001FF94706|nr:ribosome maturation factor RimM [Flagellatimonas centrodinii]ULQ46167.1 ribosome maturation factor RimM [Flagellatimonas centrodinii]